MKIFFFIVSIIFSKNFQSSGFEKISSGIILTSENFQIEFPNRGIFTIAQESNILKFGGNITERFKAYLLSGKIKDVEIYLPSKKELWKGTGEKSFGGQFIYNLFYPSQIKSGLSISFNYFTDISKIFVLHNSTEIINVYQDFKFTQFNSTLFFTKTFKNLEYYFGIQVFKLNGLWKDYESDIEISGNGDGVNGVIGTKLSLLDFFSLGLEIGGVKNFWWNVDLGFKF